MKTYLNRFVLAVAATFMLAGCELDDPEPMPSSSPAFLLKVSTTTGDSREFGYDSRGWLVRLDGKGALALNEKQESKSEVIYDGWGRISYVVTDGPTEDIENVYSYTSDNKLYKLEELINKKVESYHTFEYDGTGENARLKTRSSFYKDAPTDAAPRETSKSTFTYDASGNLSEVTQSQKTSATADWQVTQRIKYENYDGKVAVQHLTEGFLFTPGIRLHQSNPGKVTIILANGEQRVTTHTYQYNERGLPVKRTSTPDTGAPFETVYTYNL
ncbi:hypothetical protein [Rufibacter immobilis]|uniref:hypothetical protein n=1 Tax=Rufibacter immobilis TaxID=1348778 RepID=UPI0035EED2AB